MIKNSIIIPRNAHYYHIGNTKNPIRILIVLHGYGQKADKFLEYFTNSLRPDTLIVSPEGISKFYNKERETVASWMTSLHRTDEINDYCTYLDLITENLMKQYSNRISIELLGYSQGTSTACRWANNSKTNIDKLYICSGSCPPELTKQSKIKTNLYFGKFDKIVKLEYALEEIEKYKENFNVQKSVLFDGGHIVSEECLNDIK